MDANRNKDSYENKVLIGIRASLEEAYNALNFAASEMDLIDSGDATRIAKVRKQVLALIQTDLNSI